MDTLPPFIVDFFYVYRGVASEYHVRLDFGIMTLSERADRDAAGGKFML